MVLDRRYLDAAQALARACSLREGPAGAALVMDAFLYAERVHDGEVRRNGDPYLAHCVAVARIVSEVDPNATLIAAALLHDCSLKGYRFTSASSAIRCSGRHHPSKRFGP